MWNLARPVHPFPEALPLLPSTYTDIQTSPTQNPMTAAFSTHHSIFTPAWIVFFTLVCVPVAKAQSSDPGSGLSTDLSTPSSEEIETLDIALFSQGQIDGWEERSFKGDTRYQLKSDDAQGTILHALSQGSASVFAKRIKVDLTKTPYINWRWKIDNRLDGVSETTKSGDDFAARIYLVKTDGLFGRKSKAVNYVWSSNQSINTTWGNAYQPKNSKMLAVRGIENKTGEWVSEKRNVALDFRQLFNQKIDTVDLVAIMTDTDNSGLTASASYGDIYFSSQ